MGSFHVDVAVDGCGGGVGDSDGGQWNDSVRFECTIVGECFNTYSKKSNHCIIIDPRESQLQL